MAAAHTYELNAMSVIEGRYVVLVEGNGEGSFELPREIPEDVVLVHRDDLQAALDCAVTGGRLDPADPVYRRLRGYMTERAQ